MCELSISKPEERELFCRAMSWGGASRALTTKERHNAELEKQHFREVCAGGTPCAGEKKKLEQKEAQNADLYAVFTADAQPAHGPP